MRVLGSSGSLRRGSFNGALLRHAGDLFEAEGAEFEIYEGLRDLPAYDGDAELRKASALRGKPATVVGASTGAFGAVWARAELRRVLASTGARVIEGEVAVGHAMDRFGSDGSFDDENLEEQLREVVEILLREAESNHPGDVAA